MSATTSTTSTTSITGTSGGKKCPFFVKNSTTVIVFLVLIVVIILLTAFTISFYTSKEFDLDEGKRRKAILGLNGAFLGISALVFIGFLSYMLYEYVTITSIIDTCSGK